MGRKQLRARPVKEEVLRRVANVMGGMSAAQHALDRAAEIRASGGTPYFYETDTGSVLVGPEPLQLEPANRPAGG